MKLSRIVFFVVSLICLRGALATEELSPGTVFKDCDYCPEMVVIPPGSFDMGFDGPSPLAHQDRVDGPVHKVEIKRAFALGRFEVTVEQFARFVEETGRPPDQDCMAWQTNAVKKQPGKTWRDPGYSTLPDSKMPVSCVAWPTAKAFVAWLSAKTGKAYRLPSEAEWEYAAQAGSAHLYPWGPNLDDACTYANIYDASARGMRPWGELGCNDGIKELAPVGSFKPNKFGVFDMVGNVYEWAEDCWVQPYGVHPVDGRPHQIQQECIDRVIRGSAWHSPANYFRPSFRGRDLINVVSQIFGMRVARDLN